MIRTVWTALIVATVAIAANGRAVEAGLFHRRTEGTPEPGPARHFEHSHQRAGNPTKISCLAQPTYTPDYTGDFTGGGQAFGGCPRRVDEGTWGRDYEGHWLTHHVFLGWNHGRRYQGGTGSYLTQGGHIPDPIAGTAALIRSHGSGSGSGE